MENLIVATPDQLRQIVREELEQFHKSNPPQGTPQEAGKTIFNLSQFCEYTGLSKATVYKLTAKGTVPHAKRGKRIYFERSQVDAWLLQNRIGEPESKHKTGEYLIENRRRRVEK